jgi:hypothetical protein
MTNAAALGAADVPASPVATETPPEPAPDERAEVTCAPGSAAELVSATVTFKTNNDGKARNSYVSVTARDATNLIIAEVSDTFDEFKDNRQYGPYDMQVLNPVAKHLVRPGGTLTLYFGQDANDEWHTNVLLDLAFSDGSHIASEEQDLSFTGDKPKKVFGI